MQRSIQPLPLEISKLEEELRAFLRYKIIERLREGSPQKVASSLSYENMMANTLILEHLRKNNFEFCAKLFSYEATFILDSSPLQPDCLPAALSQLIFGMPAGVGKESVLENLLRRQKALRNHDKIHQAVQTENSCEIEKVSSFNHVSTVAQLPPFPYEDIKKKIERRLEEDFQNRLSEFKKREEEALIAEAEKKTRLEVQALILKLEAKVELLTQERELLQMKCELDLQAAKAEAERRSDKRVSELQLRLAETRMAKQNIEDRHAARMSRMSDLEENIRVRVSELSVREKNVQKKEQNLEQAISAEVDRQRANELTHISAREQKVQAQLSALEEESRRLGEVKTRVAEALAHQSACDARISLLESEKQELAQELKSMAVGRMSLVQQIKTLSKSNETMEAQLEVKSREISELARNVKYREEWIAKFSTSLRSLRLPHSASFGDNEGAKALDRVAELISNNKNERALFTLSGSAMK